jgi:predicted unusual protein kinase regulating ubiquinone biosynthesis (AarF/ABC1/UbiB family)
MKEMLSESDLFVVPSMLMVSESVIIMDYEAGQYHLHDIPDPHTTDEVCLILIYLQILGIYRGVLHADLHWGNFLVRVDPLRIVLYDFGLVLDLRDRNESVRQQWAQAFFDTDALQLFQFLTHDAAHTATVAGILKSMPENTPFSSRIKRVLVYCQMHALTYDVTIMSMLYACIHCEQLEKILTTMPSQSEALRRLWYPEFNCLHTLL